MKKTLRIVGLVLLSLLLLSGAAAGSLWLYLHPSVERIDGVVYGNRNGTPLTMDVLRPADESDRNGRAVALMVSGSWKSKAPGQAEVWLVAPLLRAGYTVFGICHISQPKATVMEIVEDIQRGIRFARHNAGKYGVDPGRIGIVGGSSGGHLSLMMATRGGPGDANAADPVDRESSAVQAVAIFFPVTDLLNLGSSTENLHDGGPPKSFMKAFAQTRRDDPSWKQIGREMSPLYYLTPQLPPTLIYHGDSDTLVPLDQSERFEKKAREVGAKVELVIHPGGKHGWPTMVMDEQHFVRWFDEHLRAR